MTAVQYGPHDPAMEPHTVRVLGPGKYPKAYDVPAPPALARQRAQVNGMAYDAADGDPERLP